jgi:glycosyltransferase involved in cell wall biosynthesis
MDDFSGKEVQGLNSRVLRFLKLYLSSFPGLFRFAWKVKHIFSPPAIRDPSPVEIIAGAKPVILFIDSAIPPTDRDAGAVTISQFMVLFAARGWSVYLWPLDQLDQGRMRRHLEKQNIQIVLSGHDDGLRSWLSRHSTKIAVIFLNRPAMTASLLPLLLGGNYKLAYYGHDLHSHRFMAEAAQTGHWEIRLLAKRFKKLETSISRVVDYCYYPSPEEVAEVQRLAPSANVKELPPYFFDFKQIDSPSPPPGGNLLFVGNFGHVPNVDAAIWLVQEIWPKIRARVSNVHLTIAGSNPPPSLIQMVRDTECIDITGWVTEEQLLQLYSESRIALIPLRFGAGVKHKLVTAVVRGCPVVTTETGLQGLKELKGSIGLANSPDEIASECQQLIMSDELWSFRVGSARRALADRFTADAMWRALSDLHEGA